MEKEKFTILFDQIFEQKMSFFGVFFVVIAITYSVLFIVDFIPESPEMVDQNILEEETKIVSTSNVDTVEAAENLDTPDVFVPQDATPDVIIIDKLDREIQIRNPKERSVSVLDNALLSGAVRHPDSADLLDKGTMFLFAHSSYLPKVINKNFQAFNGIQKLTWGDKIRIQSSDAEYIYRVDRVYQVKATQAEVKIQRGEAKLTLSTCNSFGSKDDRYIVESTLVETKPLTG